MTLNAEQVQEALEKIEASLDEATSAYQSEKAELSAKISKLKDWLWTHGEHNANTVTEDYVALRDRRSVLKKAYDSEDQALKDAMQRYEVWLMQACDSIGAESIKTGHGTAFIQVKRRFNCSDWPIYWSFIKEFDRFDLLEKRPAQGPLAKMLEEGEELPSGISTFSERTITVRRS